MEQETRAELAALRERLEKTLDGYRTEARDKRHGSGYRTARENLEDLVDHDTFVEYGQLAVAAQRSRRDYRELQASTAADGIITGTCTINAAQVGSLAARAAVVINDYSVLAGTQGFFHHRKLDRICELAGELRLPVVMYTEGGGGRPGDTDVTTQIAGLNVNSFATWAALSGVVPRIAVNNGYCFAGNAALFGCADFTIATRQSWIGMAGPAMIEGGGLGKYSPREIGPIEVQEKNGVVDIVADDEAHATSLARQLLGYFQGPVRQWNCGDQMPLRDIVPTDRRWAYPVRRVIETIADEGSFLELRRIFGRSVITGFIRLEGKPVGLIANDCQQLGGAVDSQAAEKAATFLDQCNVSGLPVVSLTDTPGFMVGPDNEREGAVRRMSTLFLAGARLKVPVLAIFLRKGYGLGAMAMTGGSFLRPVYAASWPTGEFGGMGLEGSVRLGYRKELEAIADLAEREALFDKLVARAYEIGQATEAASHLEIDAVIDPADTRKVLVRALASARRPGAG
jgi:acetyl-CoA carboxylase carboxyltransferase component